MELNRGIKGCCAELYAGRLVPKLKILPREVFPLLFPLFFLITTVETSLSLDSFDYEPFQRVLDNFVDGRGKVNYAELKAHPSDLDKFIQLLGRYSPENFPDMFPSREDKLAYWINAYNAFVIKGVIDNYPVKSVKDIKRFYGFFWRMEVIAGGRKYTLKTIEDDNIRKGFQEPRIHFAINCASGGCPLLENKVFTGQDLGQRLEFAARFFIDETRNVRIDPENKNLYLSQIFDWYEKDFINWYKTRYGKKEASIIDYLVLYLPMEKSDLLRKGSYKIKYIEYNWNLNDQTIF